MEELQMGDDTNGLNLLIPSETVRNYMLEKD